ncbi:MAG: hypothetical protein HIU85_05650 [Proteobacteria bacterium]|nr:hypothetical protein [Pseudomonadota bacterium]
MNKRVAHFLGAGGLGVAVSLLGASTALAYRHYDHGAVRAEGRHSVLFGLKEARPDPRITPGALNPAVDQNNIRRTICVRGYSKSIRPPEEYTERLKRLGIRRYGYSDRRLRDYEEDHLVSLELGGSPTRPRNLWPEPHHVIGGWGSYAKDRLEDRLHALVCRGRVPLVLAQREIARDWISAYKRYVGPNPYLRRRRRRAY